MTKMIDKIFLFFQTCFLYLKNNLDNEKRNICVLSKCFQHRHYKTVSCCIKLSYIEEECNHVYLALYITTRNTAFLYGDYVQDSCVGRPVSD